MADHVIDARLLGHLAGRRVLELGCGPEPRSVAFARSGAHAIAVDSSADRVAAATNRIEDEGVSVELHHADLAELAFIRADTVDVAVSDGALADVRDLDRVFRQVHRVLRPEAPVVLSLPHPAATVAEGGSYFGDRTISSVFSSLHRANFRLDTLLEPEAPDGGPVPRWLVLRARKQGT